MASFTAFLRASRAHVPPPRRGSAARPPSPSHSTSKFHVVMGNEAADLDSTACALALAYLRHKQALDQAKKFVPVINIPRVDFSLRTDVVWLMKHLSIDPTTLTFADEVPLMDCVTTTECPQIDLAALHSEKRLEISLVDHNRLAAHQEDLGSAVMECIDHHSDEKLYSSTIKHKHIEPVGSCSSLVTEEFSKHRSLLEPDLAKLLLAPILMDTYNFEPKSTKATTKDREMAALLKEFIPNSSADDFFHNLNREKTNLGALSTWDLLRRDYKEFEFGAGKIGCSSFPTPLSVCFERKDFIDQVRKYIAEHNLLFLLVNTAFTLPDGGLGRELMVYRAEKQQGLMDRLVHHLERSELQLTPHPTSYGVDGSMRVYVQHNISASRKQLVPIVSAFFSSL